jgi:hypothetical protein
MNIMELIKHFRREKDSPCQRDEIVSETLYRLQNRAVICDDAHALLLLNVLDGRDVSRCGGQKLPALWAEYPAHLNDPYRDKRRFSGSVLTFHAFRCLLREFPAHLTPQVSSNGIVAHFIASYP